MITGRQSRSAKIAMLLAAMIAFGSISCRASGGEEEKGRDETQVQKPVVAGRFYPAGEEQLGRMVEEFLDAVPSQQLQGRLIGFIAPHAGYPYSGGVAAHAYALLRADPPKRIVVIAPSHRVPFEGVLALDADFYETPLGRVPIDRTSVKQLIQGWDWITFDTRLFAREHSLEVQLPFIQKVAPKAEVIPLVMGNPSSLKLARKLAQALSSTFTADSAAPPLYVASSDLSHFLPYDRANKMDQDALQLIREMNTAHLHDVDKKGTVQLCGLGPVLTLMEIASRSSRPVVRVLKYANSGDTAGDKSRVVGYGAVAFMKR